MTTSLGTFLIPLFYPPPLLYEIVTFSIEALKFSVLETITQPSLFVLI